MLQSCIPTVSLTLFLHVSKAPWIPRFPIQCVIFTPKPQGFLLFPTSVCGTILHLVFPLSHSQLKFYWFCLLSISVGIPPLLSLSIASVLIWATIIFFFCLEYQSALPAGHTTITLTFFQSALFSPARMILWKLQYDAYDDVIHLLKILQWLAIGFFFMK